MLPAETINHIQEELYLFRIFINSINLLLFIINGFRLANMKKLLLLLFSLMLSFNSYGEWTKVNEDVEDNSYFIDFRTVKKVDDYVVWWEPV